jgi:hypothetical protein
MIVKETDMQSTLYAGMNYQSGYLRGHGNL